MLYKYPGIHEIHGDLFDYCIVDENRVDFYLRAGWHMTTTEAKSAQQVEPEPEQINRIGFRDLTPEMIQKIKTESEGMTLAAMQDKYNITYHAARMVRK